MIDFFNGFVGVLVRHSFSENVLFLTLGYFLFIFFPIRLLSIVFITPIVNRYIEPPLRYTAVMNAGMAAGLRVSERLGKKKSYHKYVTKPPRWLDNLLLYFFVNDISMMAVFTAVALFYDK
ncbi:MAG: hypothetical protein ACHQAX_04935 [Gammaproteobacteria bacterium]